jgi:hypothetical protein
MKITSEPLGLQTLASFEQVRKLVEEHKFWGMTLNDFYNQAAHNRGSTPYRFNGSMDFVGVYSLLQYIHKFYKSK